VISILASLFLEHTVYRTKENTRFSTGILSKMLSLKYDVVQICFNCFNSSSECCALRYDYDINVGRCSAVAIKERMRYVFRNIAIAAV